MQNVKTWFAQFKVGLEKAWQVVVHLPVIEPVFELLAKQRVTLALWTFGADYGVTRLGLDPDLTKMAVIIVSIVGAYLIYGLQKEVLIETAMAAPPTRDELDKIIAEEAGKLIQAKLAAGVG